MTFELVRLRARAVDELAACLARGLATGEVSPAVDLREIAAYHVTVPQGTSIPARDGVGRAQLEAIARAALAAGQPLTDPSRAIQKADEATCTSPAAFPAAG